MKTLIVTAFDQSLAPVGELTVPLMRAYAQRHGYDFMLADPETRGRHPYWTKYPAIDRALATGADIVIWLDADVLVIRPDVPVHTLMQDGKSLYICYVHAKNARLEWKNYPAHVNNGVLIIRNNAWSRAFLDRVWNNTRWLTHPLPDQSALADLLGYRAIMSPLGRDRPERKIMSHVGLLDPQWNSMPGMAVGHDPVLHHHSGMPVDIRLETIRADLESLTWRNTLSDADRAAAALFFSRFVLNLKLGTERERQFELLQAQLDFLPSLKRIAKAPLRSLLRLAQRLKS